MTTLNILMAQMNTLVGGFEVNTDKVIETLKRAESTCSAPLVVFPELTLSGYPPEDLLLRPSIEIRVAKALEQICNAMTGDGWIVLGYPRRIAGALYGFWGRDGRGRPGGWWLGTEAEIELAPHEVYLADVASWRVERVPQPPSGRPVRIAPDWVCEILSPSTAARDLGVKQRGYHRGHVGHYWIISPVERTLQVLRWTERGYLVAMAAGPGEVVRAEPFEAIELDISDIFGLPPRDGR